MIIAKSPTSLQVSKALFSSEAPEITSKECFKNALKTPSDFLQHPHLENHNDPCTDYFTINITPKRRTQKTLREITHKLCLGVLKHLPSTPTRSHSYCYERKKRRKRKSPLFLPLRSILSRVFPNPRKSKYKARRRFYNCTKKCYEDRPEYHLLCTYQDYNIGFNGNFFPSRRRLAEELQVSERMIDRANKNLQAAGDISIQSGKKKWTTNQCFLPIEYQKNPIVYPPDYIRPKLLHYIINRKLTQAKCPTLKRWIIKHFRRQKGQFAHYSFQEIKKLRAFLKKGSKNSLRKSKDPPKKRKRPLNWHLLKDFSFSFKDQAIIGRYGESCLRAALSDLKAYEGWGRVVKNKAAFLVSRCKYHLEKMQTPSQEQTPENNLEWIKKQLVDNPSIQLIQSEKDINRRDEKTTYAKILIHRESPGESLLFFWKKVHGHWIDKRIPLKHERFREVVKEFIEEPKWKAAI